MDIDDWDDDASDRRSYARVIKNIVKSKTAPAQAVKAKPHKRRVKKRIGLSNAISPVLSVGNYRRSA